MVGWHHWHNGHEFEQILEDSGGQGSLGGCSQWGVPGHSRWWAVRAKAQHLDHAGHLWRAEGREPWAGGTGGRAWCEGFAFLSERKWEDWTIKTWQGHSLTLQRVRHDLATEQQQLYCSRRRPWSLHLFILRVKHLLSKPSTLERRCWSPQTSLKPELKEAHCLFLRNNSVSFLHCSPSFIPFVKWCSLGGSCYQDQPHFGWVCVCVIYFIFIIFFKF